MEQSTRLGLSRCEGGVVKGEENEEEMRSTSDGAVDQARVEQMWRRGGKRRRKRRRNEEYQ